MSNRFDELLTQEEKDAASYLDWTDEALGAAVRHTARMIMAKDDTGPMGIQAAMLIFAGCMAQANAENMKLDWKGDHRGEPFEVQLRAKLVRGSKVTA